MAGVGERKNSVRCATMSGLHGGRVWVSEMRPGQTRSYKELFLDGLGGEGTHIKGTGWWRGGVCGSSKGSSKILGPEITAPCLCVVAPHRPSTCQPPAFVAPPYTTPTTLYNYYYYYTNHPYHRFQRHRHHDLPKIQFGFYPSKKLYNGSDARGQNPIPGKVNNLKHIIIRMMYDIKYIYIYMRK